jgi:hypothetical protein
MSTFVAMCPYCRAGGVRAPQSAVGASATCPRCKSNFTVVPSDEPPAPPTPETAETRPAPALTEPSPVLPASAVPPPAPGPTEPPAPVSGEPVPLCAVFAFVLVGPAALATQVPYGRGVALAACAAGAALACAGFGAGGRAVLWGTGAVLGHIALALALLFSPALFGLTPWRDGPPPEQPPGPWAVDTEAGTVRPATDPLDAPREAFVYGDVQVTAGATLGPLDAQPGAPRGPAHLIVRVRVQNFGESERPLADWATGRGARGVSATDANGKPLKSADRPLENPTAFDRFPPGGAAELRFAFVPPKSGAVVLKLSGAAVGAPGDVTFRFAALGAPRDR